MTLQERLVATVADIRARGRRLAELHRELTAAELKAKGKQFGGAVGVFLGAGVLALYAFGFALATIAVLLALVLPLWAALLIVTGALCVVVAILVAVGRSMVEKARRPAGETALAESKRTTALIAENVRLTTGGVRARMKPGRAAPGGFDEELAAAPLRAAAPSDATESASAAAPSPAPNPAAGPDGAPLETASGEEARRS